MVEVLLRETGHGVQEESLKRRQLLVNHIFTLLSRRLRAEAAVRLKA